MTSEPAPPAPADAAWRLYATGIGLDPDADGEADFRDMYLAGWTAGLSAALAPAPPPPASDHDDWHCHEMYQKGREHGAAAERERRRGSCGGSGGTGDWGPQHE